MILLMCEIQAIAPEKSVTSAKIWVNTHDPAEAEQRATTKLREDGYQIRRMIETTATTKDDYFPPCTSLDAFERAETEGIGLIHT